MVSGLRLNLAVGALEGIRLQKTRIAKQNVMLANCSDPFISSIIGYTLGEPDPGFAGQMIYSAVFYIAKPRILTEWEDLLATFRKHPDRGDDNLLAAQYFIREQPMEQWEIWKKILSKSVRLGSEQYLKKIWEEYNESTYLS